MRAAKKRREIKDFECPAYRGVSSSARLPCANDPVIRLARDIRDCLHPDRHLETFRAVAQKNNKNMHTRYDSVYRKYALLVLQYVQSGKDTKGVA